MVLGELLGSAVVQVLEMSVHARETRRQYSPPIVIPCALLLFPVPPYTEIYGAQQPPLRPVSASQAVPACGSFFQDPEWPEAQGMWLSVTFYRQYLSCLLRTPG